MHGFTATPAEVRSLGDALGNAGFACHAVRLPGHGTSPADLATVRHTEWTQTVEAAVAALTREGRRVAVAGVSLGALLALEVARRGRTPVDALALCGTPLRLADERAALLRWIAWLPGAVRRNAVVRKRHGRDILDEAARALSVAYDTIPLPALVELLRLRARVRRSLHRVTQPTLVLHGRHDRTAPIAVVDELRSRLVVAHPFELAIFERSAHVLTEDAERSEVAARVVDFFDRVLSTPRP